MLEKAYIATNGWTIKGNSDESPERKGENCRKASVFLENTQVILNRILIEMWMQRGHSDKVSYGNEKHVIEQWRKGDPCYKVAKPWLICVHVQCFVEGGTCNESGYLAEEISKQSFEGTAQPLLTK